MRQTLAWVGAGALVLSCSANGTSRPDRMTVENSQSVDVGGGPSLGPLGQDELNSAAAGAGLKQAFSSSLGNQGVTAADVKSVKLDRLRLAMTAPLRNGAPMQDLRFLDTLTMYISAPGLPEVRAADSLPPATGGDGGVQSASFGVGVFQVDIPPVDGVELKDYVAAESMTVRVEVAANGRPALACTVQLTVTLDVQLNPVGAAASRLPFGTP